MSSIHNIAPEVREHLKEQNPRIILKNLMDGGEWHYNDRIFVLADNYELCVVAWEIDPESWENKTNDKRRYLKTDISLGEFIKMALDTNLDETAIMAANSTLNSLKTKPTPVNDLQVSHHVLKGQLIEYNLVDKNGDIF